MSWRRWSDSPPGLSGTASVSRAHIAAIAGSGQQVRIRALRAVDLSYVVTPPSGPVKTADASWVESTLETGGLRSLRGCRILWVDAVVDCRGSGMATIKMAAIVVNVVDLEGVAALWKRFLGVGERQRIPGSVWLERQPEATASLAFSRLTSQRTVATGSIWTSERATRTKPGR